MIETLKPPLLANTQAAALRLPAEGIETRAAELVHVAGVVERRRQHFAAGRACAHEALAMVGYEVEAIGRDEDSGAPRWPGGVVGSIGHCDAAAIALVATSRNWLALGVDLEPDRPLPDDVAGYALTAVERARFAVASGGLAGWGLIAFCAKECVHKCVHPRSGTFLDFGEIEIMFGDDQRFSPLPRSPAARVALEGVNVVGRWRRWGGCIVAALGFEPPPY